MKRVTVSESGVSVQYEVHSFGKGAPRLFFTAGVHGNEVTGIYVARKLVDYLEKHPPLRGSVTVIPTVNTAAMRCMQRRNPYDGEDLNRIFPGDDGKSISHRLAASVWRETEDADMLVDLHCCGEHGLPYSLTLYGDYPAARELVSRITMPVAVHSDGTAGQLFIESVKRRNMAACIIELPSGAGKGSVNVPVGEACFASLLDLLRALHMAEGEVEGETPSFYGSLLDAESANAGLWIPSIRRGDAIEEGQLIGTADGAPVSSPASGIAMAVRPTAYLRPDDLWVMTYVQPRE